MDKGNLKVTNHYTFNKILPLIIKTLQFINHHPISRKHKWQAFKRYLKWQLGTRVLPFTVVYPFIENSKLLVEKGMTGATGNIYTGLHEFEEMGFALHTLRPNDLFADIGANIGSYTILASAIAGADTICFEPVPSTFRHLLNNIFINSLGENVTPFNIGLGDIKGNIKFSSLLDTINHVLTEEEEGSDYVEVPVGILDEYCSKRSLY